MSGWDVYCAICGAPVSTRWVGIYNESHGHNSNEDSHQPGAWTGPDDPRLAWLSDVRIIGEVSDDEGVNRVWVTGKATEDFDGQMIFEPNEPGHPPDAALNIVEQRVGDTYAVYDTSSGDDNPWAVPFHTACRQLFCHYLHISSSDLDKEAFFGSFKKLYEDGLGLTSCLNIEYGDIMSSMERQWLMHHGEEYMVSDPINVRELQAFYDKLPMREAKLQLKIKSHNANGDAFATLSQEILLLILSNMTDVASVLNTRIASPAFANTTLTRGFWLSRINSEMPWLWDFPTTDTLENADQIDWQNAYRKLWWGSNPSSQGKNRFSGLCNRRRIWEQLLPILTEGYEKPCP